MTEHTSKALKVLEDIENNGHALTKWENQFIDEIREKFDIYGDRAYVSTPQLEVLERIREDRVR